MAEAALGALTFLHGGALQEDEDCEVSVEDTVSIPLTTVAEGQGDHEAELAAVHAGVEDPEGEEEAEEGNPDRAPKPYYY